MRAWPVPGILHFLPGTGSSCVLSRLGGCGVVSVCRGRLTAGAEHTILSGLSLSRESGFFVSTWRAKPGSVLAIQDPPGEGGRPDSVQVFKYPALTCSEQASQRPRTNLLSALGDAMRRFDWCPLSALRGGVGV